ncbi:bifunctional phosphopantothenoylcysteine decarboxylase/phosphopantothenate--cysteine ligase CoaBC [Gynurincola endophyticus]|uniref:bifunctional phosphopantothenoylcysteine decarboxylase/phosphopantothenate--cysteine ligase CoaBC n=1 Tax=Gynurincola endophyticus TaxID=2479004 RepID=UPI000F8F498E|nr:bifunctional phosphopantothenoylcysteine decarboxylase/phosphopantothenate--cysteine ligase CoaBC [Gynurincola endophyticus]
MIKGKKIIVGITGGIAAYKAILLTRLLIKAGAEVQIIMTPAAKDFVTPLTLSTLSKRPVIIDLFNEQAWENHVALGRWADLMLIAPASCNTIAKMANGLCDNMLLATYLSATCAVWIAPAMDEDMWHHKSTQLNLEKISSFGNHIIPSEEGELASGLFGMGRMAEPETILQAIEHFFTPKILLGKKVLITAGPTYEPIDPVRFIGNRSSGKMGIALAKAAAAAGAEVTLVLGPSSIDISALPVNVVKVETAEEMFQAAMKEQKNFDIAILSAAVADYTPETVAEEKIKKSGDALSLHLKKTKDILGVLGKEKSNGQIVVGFALETHNAEAYAQEKLQRKNADMIVMNSLQDPNAGFGYNTNTVTIFTHQQKPQAFPNQSKDNVAKAILAEIQKITA